MAGFPSLPQPTPQAPASPAGEVAARYGIQNSDDLIKSSIAGHQSVTEGPNVLTEGTNTSLPTVWHSKSMNGGGRIAGAGAMNVGSILQFGDKATVEMPHSLSSMSGD